MKTLLITALILFMSCKAFSQFTPKASFDYFATGYNTKTAVQADPSVSNERTEMIMRYGSFRVRIGGEYAIKKLSVHFEQHVYMNKAKNVTFAPTQAEWYAGVKYKFTDKIMVKYEHMCTHPVGSDGSQATQTSLYGGYNMISVSYGYNN